MSKHWRICWLCGLFLSICGNASAAADGTGNGGREVGPTVNGASNRAVDRGEQNAVATPQAEQPIPTRHIDTAILIIGSPSVVKDLGLDQRQRAALSKLLDEVGPAYWLLRDEPPARSGEKVARLVERLETGLAEILRPGQRLRLDQILLQYRGPQALLRGEMIEALDLSADQLTKINAVFEHTRLELAKLQKRAADGKAPDLGQASRAIHQREQDLLLAVLTDDQKREWVALRGERFDPSGLQPLPVRAPAFQDATTWVNGGPLKMEELRGRVVVVTFFTFSCINCIRNYPTLKEWQAMYADKDVTIVGIHTPEVRGDHDVDRLREKMEENGIRFPVLVDNHKKNWDAWANRVWPSVYLVDKRGYVRFWWYGELNWPGTRGDERMRVRINQLLRDPHTPTARAARGEALIHPE